MMPSRRRTDGSRRLVLPNQAPRPAVGAAAIASTRSSVVFPEPFGPIKPSTSPGASLSVTSKTPFPPPYERLRSTALSRLGSEAVSTFMEIARLDPLLDDGVHHLCRDPLLAELLGIALDRRHDLAFHEGRHVLEPLLRLRLPGHLRPLLLQGVRDFAPHVELHVHGCRRDHR